MRETMQTDNIILDFFAWWNTAMAGSDPLRAEGFAPFFHEDGRLIVNGNLRATGPAELAAHYQAIADRLDLVEMVLPVEEAFATENHAFAHCRTRARSGDSESAEEAMAYALVDGGRMRLLRVVSLSV